MSEHSGAHDAIGLLIDMIWKLVCWLVETMLHTLVIMEDVMLSLEN